MPTVLERAITALCLAGVVGLMAFLTVAWWF